MVTFQNFVYKLQPRLFTLPPFLKTFMYTLANVSLL